MVWERCTFCLTITILLDLGVDRAKLSCIASQLNVP